MDSLQTQTNTPPESHPHLQQAHAAAKKLGPNTVQVWPGGQTFNTITAALAACGGATPENQYQVAIGPGTYVENITVHSNIFLSGAGTGQTILNGVGGVVYNGTIMLSGNTGVSMMTVNANAAPGNTNAIAIYAFEDSTFMGSGLAINANDYGEASCAVSGICNLAGGAFVVELASSTIQTTATGPGSGSTGILLSGAASSLNMELSTINANGTGSVGVLTTNNATAVVEDSTITGSRYSLDNDDQKSPITANQCTLTGAVTPGVTVNP